MSEFDKEKEREKLREQLADEEESRQTTQQMSELLLKGATMLNIHCDQCASPIFSYEGEEFCPTCERTVEEIQAQAEEPERQPTPDQPASPSQESTEEAPAEQAPANQPRQTVERSVPQTNAGEALEAAISRLADRAATAEDPRQATELLEAARTAADTLAIVEGRDQRGS